jgi:hypothetical protein
MGKRLVLTGVRQLDYELFDWTHQNLAVLETPQVSVTLAPHDSSLWFVSDTPISSAPEQLP